MRRAFTLVELLVVIAIIASNAFGQARHWEPTGRLGSRWASDRETNRHIRGPQYDRLKDELERDPAEVQPRKHVAKPGQRLTDEQKKYNRWFDANYRVAKDGTAVPRKKWPAPKPAK